MNRKINNIVIVGKTNVGKSTLFNTLLGKREAITGNHTGLTRDYQTTQCIIDDIVFHLTDTAGYTVTKDDLSHKLNKNGPEYTGRHWYKDKRKRYYKKQQLNTKNRNRFKDCKQRF